MAITRGNKSTERDANLASIPTSWTTAPAAGSKVVVWVWWGSNTAPTSVADNGSPSRTFSLAKSQLATGGSGAIYYADNVQPSGTYTVTVTWAAAVFGSVGGLAYGNVATGAPTATNGATSGSSTAVSSGAVTQASNALYVGVFGNDGGGANSQTILNGWTSQFSLPDGTTFTEGAGSDLINATGSQTAAWTLQFAQVNAAAIAVWPEVAGGTPHSQALTVTSTTTPSVGKQVGKTTSVLSATVPRLVKQVGKGLSVASTTVVSIAKQTAKVLAVVSTTVPSLARQIGKLASVQSTTIASLSRQTSKAIAVQSATLATLLKQAGKTAAVQSTTLVSLATRTGKGVVLSVLSATTPSIVIQRGKGVVLTVTSTTVAVMARQVGKALAVQGATVTSITRQIGKVAQVASSTLPSIQKAIGKALAAVSSTLVSAVTLRGIGQPGTTLRFFVSSLRPSTSLASAEPIAALNDVESQTGFSSAEPITSLTDTESPSGTSTNVRGQ